MVLSRTHPFLTLVISEVAGLMKSKARNSIASAWALVLLGLGLVSDGVSAQPQGGAQVSIESQDASGTHILLNAMLWTPPGTAKGAVVLVHGSSGWTDYTVGHYGRALSAAGYAALAFDAFGARGVGSTGNDQTQVTAMQMTRDAYAARQFLLGRGFKSDRLGVMGFSKGGLAAMQAADFPRCEAAGAPIPGLSARRRPSHRRPASRAGSRSQAAPCSRACAPFRGRTQ